MRIATSMMTTTTSWKLAQIHIHSFYVRSYQKLYQETFKMGANQSANAKGKGFKHPLPVGVRGRKSLISTNKRGSAPHGLTASVVSIPSEHLHALRHCDEELDVTSAMSVHSDDVHVVKEEEESLSDSESDDDESKLSSPLFRG
jgi:hypothetical protein